MFSWRRYFCWQCNHKEWSYRAIKRRILGVHRAIVVTISPFASLRWYWSSIAYSCFSYALWSLSSHCSKYLTFKANCHVLSLKLSARATLDNSLTILNNLLMLLLCQASLTTLKIAEGMLKHKRIVKGNFCIRERESYSDNDRICNIKVVNLRTYSRIVAVCRSSLNFCLASYTTFTR